MDYAVEAKSFQAMKDWVEKNCDAIFIVRPEYLAIRARYRGQGADFTLCRVEGCYRDGRHPDEVKPGTILDDLSRRDFTMNSMALDINTFELIDPNNGRRDLMNRKIVCVGKTYERLQEDPLRLLRAMRFSITLNMEMDPVLFSFFTQEWMKLIRKTVSVERIREELSRCFQHDTCKTLRFLGSRFSGGMLKSLLGDELWLNPTLAKK